jgi:hypothetical protein
MICVSKTFHRPSTQIEWFQPQQEFKTYRRTEFFKNGRIKEMTSIESSDKLSISILTIFVDEDAYAAYEADPQCMANYQSRLAYNELNRIRTEPSVRTNV